MKKVVSIALFGEGDKYAQYMPAFLRAHLNLFPIAEDWLLRVHIDDIVSDHFLMEASERDLLEVDYMGGDVPLTRAMLWRLAPIFDTNADYVFCRDIDACPMPRDRAVCESFMESTCVIHTVHDNPMHAGIMGGLCGFHAPAFREWTGLKSLDEFYGVCERVRMPKWSMHGTDQYVLNRLFTGKNSPSIFQHHYAGWDAGKATGKVRPPEVYGCQTVTEPTPDIGIGRWPAGHYLNALADQLANHLGAAGYDHTAASKFWDDYGDKQVAKLVKECES